MAQLKQREIDRIYDALRPRLGAAGGAGGTVVVTIPPHTHSADQIGSTAAGDVAAENVQAAIEELASEKLARDGSQTVTGDLDHAHHSIVNVDDADIEGTATIGGDADIAGNLTVDLDADISGNLAVTLDAGVDGTLTVGEDVILTEAAGGAKVSGVRVLTLAGTEAAGEGRVESINSLAFNSIAPVVAVGKAAWDSVEDILCVFVESGA